MAVAAVVARDNIGNRYQVNSFVADGVDKTLSYDLN